jgi:hypothetical protein
LARARPSLVRARIRSRSNSARPPITASIKRPCGAVVAPRLTGASYWHGDRSNGPARTGSTRVRTSARAIRMAVPGCCTVPLTSNWVRACLTLATRPTWAALWSISRQPDKPEPPKAICEARPAQARRSRAGRR